MPMRRRLTHLTVTIGLFAALATLPAAAEDTVGLVDPGTGLW